MHKRTTQVEIIVFKIVNSKILFLLLKRNEQKGSFWQPVTGGVEDGESLTQAVDRELREETGIEEYLRLINDVYYFEFDTEEYGILKEYVFGVEVAPDINAKLSPEHTEMKWCTLEESLALLKYDTNKTALKNLISLIDQKKIILQLNTYENYPHCIIFVSNLFSLTLYLIGAFIIFQIGLICLAIYLLYILWLETNVMRKSCVNCFYYGKYCAFGKGKLAALFFKRGNPENFIKRQITWKTMIPDALVALVPLVVGVVLLIKNFSWFILILMILLAALTTAGNGFIRGSLACKFCKQKELGCPAEKLFNKKK